MARRPAKDSADEVYRDRPKKIYTPKAIMPEIKEAINGRPILPPQVVGPKADYKRPITTADRMGFGNNYGAEAAGIRERSGTVLKTVGTSIGAYETGHDKHLNSLFNNLSSDPQSQQDLYNGRHPPEADRMPSGESTIANTPVADEMSTFADNANKLPKLVIAKGGIGRSARLSMRDAPMPTPKSSLTAEEMAVNRRRNNVNKMSATDPNQGTLF